MFFFLLNEILALADSCTEKAANLREYKTLVLSILQLFFGTATLVIQKATHLIEVCLLTMFVGYDICCLITLVDNDGCRIMTFVANFDISGLYGLSHYRTSLKGLLRGFHLD